MPFINNPGGNNYAANNNQNGEKKRTNFPIGRLYGADGKMDVSIWIADTGVRTILSITTAVKDPNGNNIFEQKKPNELPRFFMNLDMIRAVIEGMETFKNDPSNTNISIKKTDGSSITIMGQGSNVKITIEANAMSGSQKRLDTRTITFESVAVGSKNIHTAYLNLIEYLKIAYKKALTNKLDPETFGSGESDEDAPF